MTGHLIGVCLTSFAAGIIAGLYLIRRDRPALYLLLLLIIGMISAVVGTSIHVDVERTKARIDEVKKLEMVIQK